MPLAERHAAGAADARPASATSSPSSRTWWAYAAASTARSGYPRRGTTRRPSTSPTRTRSSARTRRSGGRGAAAALDFELEVACVLGTGGHLADREPRRGRRSSATRSSTTGRRATCRRREMQIGPRPGQGQGLLHLDRPVAGHRRRARPTRPTRRVPRPRVLGRVNGAVVGRDRLSQHGLDVRDDGRLRLPRLRGRARRRARPPAPPAAAAASPSCGAGPAARTRRRWSPATSSRSPSTGSAP